MQRTMTLPTTFFLVLVALVAYILFILPLAPAPASPGLQHAIERHGETAIKAASCIEDPNSHIFFNEQTNRKGYACMIDGRWAVAITENGRKVTAFFKEKLKRLDQVIRYMENTGYNLPQ